MINDEQHEYKMNEGNALKAEGRDHTSRLDRYHHTEELRS